MSTTINNRIICNEAHANLDEYYGPYNSVSEALEFLLSETINGVNYNKRCVGLTIGVLSNGAITEYWFKNGTGDNDLVEKNTGGGGGLPGNLKVVTFDKNGATSGVQNSVITDTDGNIVLPEPTITKSGTTFSKWSYNGAQKNPGDVITIGSTTVVQAIWNNPTPTTYTVSWTNDSNTVITGVYGDNIPITSDSTEIPAGSTVVLTATPESGYQFNTWTGSIPSGATINNNNMTFIINSDITGIRAVSEPIPTIRFYYYGCNSVTTKWFNDLDELKASYGENITINNKECGYDILYVIKNDNNSPNCTYDKDIVLTFSPLNDCPDDEGGTIYKHFVEENLVEEGSNKTTEALTEKGEYIFILIDKEGELKNKLFTISIS